MGKSKRKADKAPEEVVVWVHGRSRAERRRARFEATMDRPWRMDYDLAYDGGGGAFTVYYRTRLGARWSAFWHLNFRSYGGSARLVINPLRRERPVGGFE